MIIDFPGRKVVLVGTAHVSDDSVKEVFSVIEQENPDRVCVELDKGRYETLIKKSKWQDLDIRQILKKRKGFLLLTNLVLHSFQKKIGLEQAVEPGAEMLEAIKLAKEKEISFMLCDRNIQITLQRAWRKSGLWGRLKLLSGLLSAAFLSNKVDANEIEKLKEKGALQSMMEELSEYLPAVKDVLIDERDRYLATRIYAAGGSCTVAVIGAGHLEGIVRWLSKFAAETPKDLSLKDLEEIPPKTILTRIIPWLVPALVVGFIAYGFVNAGSELTFDKIIQWILVNGTSAALGAVLALAHPLTVISAFVAAPITSVNPTIGVGIFTGLVQAFLRKPRVSDFENLSQDVLSLRGVFRNRVTHILIVFFLSSMGSAVGTFVGLSFLSGILRQG